jgi:hypothetical protein
MTDIKQQMQQARTLIESKRYDEARRILEGIDHPKAVEWLARLPSAKSKPIRTGGVPTLVMIFAMVICLLAGAAGGYFAGRESIRRDIAAGFQRAMGTNFSTPAPPSGIELTATSIVLTNEQRLIEATGTAQSSGQ